MLSLCLLCVLFFLIVKNRDISLPDKENFLNKKYFSSDKNIYTDSKNSNIPYKEEKQKEPDITYPLTPSVSNVQATSTKDQTKTQVVPTSTAATYEQLSEGTSDTDPTYRPAVSPCVSPVGYKIGTFDSRFGISREQFIKEVSQSASVWSDVINKTLFYYDEHGPLTINLIYDKRQATTIDVNYLVLEIENAKRNAESIREAYEQEKNIYSKDSEQLTKDIDIFQMQNKAYTAKVDTYNASGGAQKIEYDAMMMELAQLKQTAKSLDERKQAMQELALSINKKVVHYNEFVVYTNSLIKQSNALGAKKFTEGRFTPYTNTIDIYQYNDSIKLRRVLTHELGHVLGINHNKNAQSIMYSFNSATTTSLSKEDIHDLQSVCSSYNNQ